MKTLCYSVGVIENTSHDIETFLLVFTEITLGCEQLNARYLELKAVSLASLTTAILPSNYA